MSTIIVGISPRTAAKLILANEIELSRHWDLTQANEILFALENLSTKEVLSVVDSNPYGKIADIEDIPQFGKIETLKKVPEYFMQKGTDQADYPQMGFFLKEDITASLAANTKFGENHGKTAALMGIIVCQQKRFSASGLSYAFSKLSEKRKDIILSRLLIRIPIMQIILNQAKSNTYNGFDALQKLSESTSIRRSSNIRSILTYMEPFYDCSMLERIQRIFWESEVTTCESTK